MHVRPYFRIGKRALPGFSPRNCRAAFTTASPPDVLFFEKLHSNIKSLGDLEYVHIANKYRSEVFPSSVRPIVIVKVGGDVVANDLVNLVNSLRFLRQSGFMPVVVHGGGPQVNDELKKAGVEPQYIKGHRVTDEATMRVAEKVFVNINQQLSDALRAAHLPVRQFFSGIFKSTVASPEMGLVGKIEAVSVDEINTALLSGQIPVLTSLGKDMGSQVDRNLNINADVAARELALALFPTKVAFISAGGSWKENNVPVSEVDMSQDYERLANKDYTGRQGTLLKLNEVKEIIDNLPACCSVIITSASNLANQLVPHSGPGTQFRKGSKLLYTNNISSLDEKKINALLELTAPGRKILGELVNKGTSSGSPYTFVIDENYSTVAVVKGNATSSQGPSELVEVIILPSALMEGMELALWKKLKNSFPNGLYWFDQEKNTEAGSNLTEKFPSLSKDRSSAFAVGSQTLATGRSLLWSCTQVPNIQALLKPISPSTESSETSQCDQAKSATKPMAFSSNSSRGVRIGILGGRGYVGVELVKLLAKHPEFLITAASSRALVGQSLPEALKVPEAVGACAEGLIFEDLDAEKLRNGSHAPVDAWVLALPNNQCAPLVHAIESRHASTGKLLPLLLDLSADHRFDHSNNWVYGLPEKKGQREKLRHARKISNPGCYATGAQMGILPLLRGEHGHAAWDLKHKLHIFGVSGYSGAGTTPSEKNDPNRLRDNLLPYALTNHIHEREIAWQNGLGSNSPSSDVALGAGGVAFMPHVAPFFQGISLTVTGHLDPKRKTDVSGLLEQYRSYYENEKLVTVLDTCPDVQRHGTLQHGVTIGGLTYDSYSSRLALTVCLDNLLKGAATQALQNLNLALGLPEYSGIPLNNMKSI